MIGEKDYYSILKVDEQAGPQEIRDAYRRLAFRYHPDRNEGDATAGEHMKDINEAYAVLSDPRKRSEYDILRQQYGPFASSRFKRGYSDEDIFRGSDIDHIFEEMARAFGFSGFDEVFRSWYGAGYRGFASRSPGTFGRGFAHRRPFSGGYRYGGGTGAGAGFSGATTSAPGFPLGGKIGKLTRYLLKKLWGLEWPERGKDRYDVLALHPRQAQQGGEIRYRHGKRSKDLVIAIPPGTPDGQQIRLRGMGNAGKGGGQAGDLYLTVRVKRSLLKKIRDIVEQITAAR